MNGNYNARVLLNKLIELMQPNSPKIEAIKHAEAEAQDLVELVEKENKEYNAQLEENQASIELKDNEISEVLAFKEAAIPLSEKYISIIEANKIPFDLAAITAGCKKTVEIKQKEIDDISAKIEEIKAKIADNEQKQATAEQIIKETEPKLYSAEDNRKELENLINLAIEENGRTLSKDRICPTLAKLEEFSEDEMETLSEYIIYPKKGLKVALSEFEGRGKSTKDMVKEAIKTGEEKADTNLEEQDKVKLEEIEERPLDKIENLIDKKKNEAIKVVTTELKEEKTLEIKEEKPVDEKREYLYNILGVSDEDIKFTPEIDKLSKFELEKAVKKLKDNNIDPKSVSLKNYCGNIDQLIANIQTMIRENYALDDQEIAKNPYLGVVPTERIVKDVAIVKQSGLTLKKASGKIAVAVVSRRPEKLDAAINLIGSIDIRYFMNNPENMAKIIGGTAAMMLYCQQNGINYEGESFIENEREFVELYGPIDPNIIPLAKECNQALINVIDNPEILRLLNTYRKSEEYYDTVNMNQVDLQRFNSISEKLKEKNTSDLDNTIEIDGIKFLSANFYKNLAYLLSNQALNASNDDLILSSLFFNNHKTAADVKTIKHSLDPNNIRLVA